MRSADLTELAALLREAGERQLKPRFGKLAAGDIHEKGPDDIVTEADLAAERWLTPRLEKLFPGALIVGEEAAHADPSLLDGLAEAPLALVLDPLEGTAHFAKGNPIFGLIAALFRHGETILGVVSQTMTGREVLAEKGAGVTLDGRQVRFTGLPDVAAVRGGFHTGMTPPEWTEAIRGGVLPQIASNDAVGCSAALDILMLEGKMDAASFWRLMPWDHAAGALAVQEAGGKAALFNGSAYRAARDRTGGLLVASSPELWERLRALF